MADIHQQQGERAETAPEAPRDPVLHQLEAWLTAILDDRASRAAS